MMIRPHGALTSRMGRFSGGKWPPGSSIHTHAIPNPLRVGERLKEGVGGRQRLRKSLGIGHRAECADADRGEDRRFGIRVITHMHLHHGSEWQSAAMLDDSRHMRPHALASSKHPKQGTIIRSAASCSKGLQLVTQAPATPGIVGGGGFCVWRGARRPNLNCLPPIPPVVREES